LASGGDELDRQHGERDEQVERQAGYMDLRQLLATNICRLCHERKVSQEQLAHDAGIGTNLRSLWLSDKQAKTTYARGGSRYREKPLPPRRTQISSVIIPL
jgi:hypothetical protein